MNVLGDLLLGLYWLARAVVDAVLGRRRRSYVTHIDIKAPRDIVFSLSDIN